MKYWSFKTTVNIIKIRIWKVLKNFSLIILGEGEKLKELMDLSKELNIEKKIKFLGHIENPYNYIKSSLCVLVTSLWEDPGFVMIEASALKKIVISSNCPSGPKEFFVNGKNGFLFKNNDRISLVDEYLKFKKSNIQELMNKKINLKKFSKNFSVFKHFQSLEKILSN